MTPRSAAWVRLASALVVPLGLLAVLALTLAAFGLNVPEAMRLIAVGAVGDQFGISRTLVRSTPLLLTGLGVVVAWRAGMYNIGGEGQYVVGGLAGALTAKLLSGLDGGLLNPIILVSTATGGALFAGLAAWLQVRRGVQVVISTILLNFVALQLLSYMVRGPLQEAAQRLPQTDRLPQAAMLMRFDPQTDLHSGVFIAVAAAFVVLAYLYGTKAGFRLRLVGANPDAARANGVNVSSVQMQAMLVSGGLCGLAGGVTYLGVTGYIGDGFSENWGFLGIPVALLGGLHPIGALFGSLFFGALFAGSVNLARFTPIGATIVSVVQAVAVLGFVFLKEVVDRRLQPKVADE